MLMLLTSCSSVRFDSSFENPVTFNKLEKDKIKVSFEVDLDFYIWGLFPGVQAIDLSKEAGLRGYDGLSEITISEKNDTKNWTWPLFSLGLYYPRTFVIEGKASKFR